MKRVNFSMPESLLAKVDAQKPEFLDRNSFLCLLIDQCLTRCSDQRLTRCSKVPAYCVGAEGPLGNLRPLTGATPPPQQLANEASSEAPLHTVAAPKAQSGDPVEKKIKENRFCFSVPDDLSEFKADLMEFWREHKSGKKSEAAAKILISGCRKIKERYGNKALAEQLELAKGYGWENITLKNYERFGLAPSKGNYTPEPTKHPAGRVFTAARGFDTEPTNPALEDLF